MDSKYPPPVLDELAHFICNSRTTSADADLLEKDVLRKLGLSGGFEDLTSTVLRFFTQEEYGDVIKALNYLIESRRTMARLANEVAESDDNSYCELDAEMALGIRRFLEAMAFPMIEWPPGYETPSQIMTELESITREIDQKKPTEYREYVLKGWLSLETLLRVAFNFYGELFGGDESSPVAEAFQKARKCRNLNPLLDMIRHLQKPFEVDKDANPSDQEISRLSREICQLYTGRDNPFEDFLRSKKIINLDDYPSRWRQSLAKFDQKAEGKVKHLEIDELSWWKANVDFYRNLHTHKSKKVELDAVRESLNQARIIIGQLSQFCPELILLVEEGFDMYGRRIVRFVGEQELQRDEHYINLNVSKKARPIFVKRQEQLLLHHFYFCPRPARAGMFEPILISAETILQDI